MSNLQTQIAAEVRARFARAGGNCRTLETVLGVSAPTARKRWSGEAPYTVDELDAIATHFGATVSDLLQPPAVTAA